MDIKGLATGIGSLPYKDVDAALDLIFKYTPQIPFWPQLPRRDIREGMVAQFSEGLPCVKVTDKGIFFDPTDKEKELEKFYERIINKDIEYFKISGDFAQGLHAFYNRLNQSELRHIKFIKCHITGPFSFAASIKGEDGKALLHDPVFMQAIINGLAMKALWQIKLFKKFGKVIVFIDEPYLASFGSAYTPVNREDVVKGLTELIERVKEPGDVLSGVHCCGNTDWPIFTDIKAIDIINFDAYNYLDRFLLYFENLLGFLGRGGILAWGIVPTESLNREINVSELARRLNEACNQLVSKGIEEEIIKKRLILTPSCGLGTLSHDKAETIFKCLSELSSFVKVECD
ncbi:MAG: methionine synthase [Candidatus Omnitrophota bacterium]